MYNEINMSAQYTENSVFSLDGLHLNAYGQAMLTNIFIKSINYTYQTKIELLDVMNFKNL
jgi:hypothetical protein